MVCGAAFPGRRGASLLPGQQIEKQAVETAFPDAIFVTFNGSELRPLFPDRMPIFYMYSVRRGVAVKPWFMPAEREATALQTETIR